MRKGQKIRLWSNGHGRSKWTGLGYQSPKPIPCDELAAGEVGFLFANIKTVSDAQIGDTITDAANPAAEPLPGFEEIKPMVFAGLYPVESHEHGLLRDALEKLRLNDSARSTSSRKIPWRWASDSAADSWACCTWRSCRSGWSASSRST